MNTTRHILTEKHRNDTQYGLGSQRRNENRQKKMRSSMQECASHLKGIDMLDTWSKDELAMIDDHKLKFRMQIHDDSLCALELCYSNLFIEERVVVVPSASMSAEARINQLSCGFFLFGNFHETCNRFVQT